MAAGLLAVWAAGLARLGLALTAVARLRRRSRPAVDPTLADDVASLRAELGLARPVDLRVCDDLTSPATVGWLRPALLLPPDWAGWDPHERRAVLAHELAHVARADYLSGLWAQFCLAVHLYHPLAHWLVAGLRLDQELAADATGARLSGGNRPYLQALARLALRRPERRSARLARPFLPSRNAFLRRIEMLRDAKTDPVRNGPLPPLTRWLTAACLASAALALTGLRGPAGLGLAQAQGLGQPPDDRKAQLQRQVNELNRQIHDIELQEALKSDRPGGALDLSHAPAATVAAVVGRTADLLGRPEFKPVAELVNAQSPPDAPFPVRAEEIDWTTLLLLRRDGHPGQADELVVLRMKAPHDWKAVAAKLPGGPEEVARGGTFYVQAKARPGNQAMFTPDDRTIAVGSPVAVAALVDARAQNAPVAHRWDDAWAKLGARGDVNVAFDPSWIGDGLRQGGTPGPLQNALAAFAPLFQKATGYAAALRFDPGLSVEAVATSPSPADAAAVRETVGALLTLGKNSLAGLRADVGRHDPSVALFDLLGSLLEAARPENEPRDGDRVVRYRARTERNAAAVVGQLLPAMVAARSAAQRAQSTNNLKQIALAMHNYADTYGHFPPAVLTGPDGKTPYSWRVALLPFLEQKYLYDQYDFGQPWDSPRNRKVLEAMPPVYRHPADTRGSRDSAYFVPVGEATIFPPGGKGTPIAQIVDGTSNTLLAVEAKRDTPWTKPEDVAVTPMADPAVPELGGFWPGAFLGAMADGSVRAFVPTINPVVLKALLSKSGGEVLDFDAIQNPARRIQPPPPPRR